MKKPTKKEPAHHVWPCCLKSLEDKSHGMYFCTTLTPPPMENKQPKIIEGKLSNRPLFTCDCACHTGGRATHISCTYCQVYKEGRQEAIKECIAALKQEEQAAGDTCLASEGTVGCEEANQFMYDQLILQSLLNKNE